MKNAMKKMLVLVTALVMSLAMAATAFADGSNSITIKEDGQSHTYNVYQILKGTYDSTTQELKNIDWGANVTSDTNAAAAFAEVSSTSTVSVDVNNAKVTIAGTEYTLTGTPKTITYNNGYSLTGLEDGYYVVIDVVSDALNDQDDAYSAGIVKVAGGNVEVEPKSATPSVDKQVLDETADAEAGSTDGWGETADHSLYETYQYKLIATLPNDADLDEYEHYYLQFEDSLSRGVTYAGNLKVTVNGTDATDSFTVAGVNAGTAGAVKFTVTIADLKTVVSNLKGAKVVVTYDAYLNNEAVIGNEDDNQNTVDLKYSNDTTYTGTGTPKTGKTGPDTVFTFTYKVDNTKIDGTTKDELAGAEFKLYSDSACTAEVGLIYDETLAAYRPVTDDETATVMTSDADGLFNIKGVDAGTYYIKETKAPTGYNALTDAIEVVISATHVENSDTVSATTTIDTEKSKNMENTVENFNGTTLPTTGGMGTTIFYIVGALMVVFAGVLLVTRRRMAK